MDRVDRTVRMFVALVALAALWCPVLAAQRVASAPKPGAVKKRSAPVVVKRGPEDPAATTSIPVKPGRGGLRLVLVLGPEGVELLDARPLAEKPRRSRMRRPLFESKEVLDLPRGTSEYLFTLYDRSGHRLQTLALPGSPLHFYDEVVRGGRGELRSLPFRPHADVRTIDLPPIEGVAFIGVFRATLVGRKSQASPSPTDPVDPALPSTRVPAPRASASSKSAPSLMRSGSPPPDSIDDFREPIDIRNLVLFDLRDLPPDRIPPPSSLPPLPLQERPRIPPFPFDHPLPRFPVFVDKVILWHLDRNICPATDGAFIDVVPLADSGSRVGKFDIVILGDGFTSDVASMDKLDRYASRYTNSLLAMEPFKTQTANGKINVFLVRTSSTQSGVTNCPGTDRRATYYHVSGRWTDVTGTVGPPGFFGTKDWCTIWNSLAKATDIDTVDLIVMIANCDIYGGDAEPDNSIAFLPTPSSWSDFEGLGPHESGHAIAATREEYAACIAYDPSRPEHPNIEQAPKHLSAWWKLLADPATELDPSTQDFLAVHDRGDTLDTGGCTGGGGCCQPIVTLPAKIDMIGAFWGAQYGDPGGTTISGCDPYCDDAGTITMPMSGDWYRPQATCRMRNISKDFCKACQYLLNEEVIKAAP